jgi:hypothetical protein
MSVLGTVILMLLTAGLTYFGTSFLGGGAMGAVQLSPEIQKYLDSKLAGSPNAEQELQKLVARITEMETKLVEVEKVRASHEQLAGKSEAIETVIGEQRRRKEEAMANARAAELAQLRNDIATACAGVTIKRVQSNSTGASGSPADAEAYRRNLGIDGNPGQGGQGGRGMGRGGRGGRGGGGGGGGNPEMMQQRMQMRGGGGGGRGGRGRGGMGGGQQGGGQGGQTP